MDLRQDIEDLQAAMRTLWPDRKVIYFTTAAADESAKGPGVLLTHEEYELLVRTARAIADRRTVTTQEERN